MGPGRPDPTQADELARLSHDLCTQLAVVSGHAQLLRRDATRLAGLADRDRARLLARAGAIEAAAGAMATMVEQRPDRSGTQRTGRPVTLFTREGCVESALVLACLRLAGVPFVEREVTGDPAAAAALAATGIFATPVVVSGGRAFLAYPRDALAEALGFRCRCPDLVA